MLQHALVSAAELPSHQPYIPADKGLDPAWVASLPERGERRGYQGDELKLIGMPCGGIGAGQLEIAGDGKLGTWWIFNIAPPPNGGLGSSNGARYLKPAPIEHTVDNGFAIRIQGGDNIFFTRRDDTVYAFITGIPDWKRGERKEFVIRSVEVGFEYQPYFGHHENFHLNEWTAGPTVSLSEPGKFTATMPAPKAGSYSIRALVKHPKVTLRGENVRRNLK